MKNKNFDDIFDMVTRLKNTLPPLMSPTMKRHLDMFERLRGLKLRIHPETKEMMSRCRRSTKQLEALSKYHDQNHRKELLELIDKSLSTRMTFRL